MSFTYDLATVVGKVRLYIKDTSGTTPLFTDEELAVIIGNNASNMYLAASDALTILAGDAGRLAVYISLLGGETVIDRKGIANQLMAVAAKFEERAFQLDTSDEFVDWHLHLAVHDGRDETDYPKDDADQHEKTYHDVHYVNRGGEA